MLRFKCRFLFLTFSFFQLCFAEGEGNFLYYWNEDWHGEHIVNFGDYISLKLVERIVQEPIRVCKNPKTNREKKFLAIGSILSFALDGDVVWGTGVNGKLLKEKSYRFKQLDIRAVRGPLTRQFLKEKMNIDCPEIYGDPALLFPYFFPEMKKQKYPSRKYIVIPHYSERSLFPKTEFPEAVHPTEPWDKVVESILDSEFVIASSLHGIIIAEAYGIPARMLRVTKNENLFKYQDYYLGTNRHHFKYATSIDEALRMGGEKLPECDLQKLYEAFPFDIWPNSFFQQPDFSKNKTEYEKQHA